ncbi:monofunctional biosynthetic peptidoglycan transglycosylase [Bacillus sp. FJAT-27225]|uniref:transglycosylase domain-containing protein n=1 Tax=Bacillus sp. FJAT-27225 TaxID=1743144 RepID=UPI00080C26B1|nr:PBP1A family penicillin-binding protein [Bacillus sp. FJAT-27225]OCA82353.1 monofunctional biosynthetic peptidoglycan transglycosylase [Bacillus sp. FJAT-27225]
MEAITGKGLKQAVKYVRAGVFLGLILMGIATVFVTGILIYARVLGSPPLAVPQSTLYFSDDGKVIGETNTGQKRYWVKLDDISPYLVEATISIEDKKFFEHKGFDLKRIAGAALADIKAFEKVQGASTVTQQYARNLFLEHDKTWSRKLREAMYAIRLEMNYSKEQILEGYLNTIYYGNRAYGIQAASQYYFGKNASELSLAEASMLAGIPKGPAAFSPFASMERAKQRQGLILDAMTKNGYIKETEAKAAVKEGLALTGTDPHRELKAAPYFQDAVANALRYQLGIDERTIELGGLRVYTTLDQKQQEAAEKQIKAIIAADSDIQAALVAVDPRSGQIKAMVGGRDYEKSPFNRAVQAVREPGSTIKPLLYYAALSHGFTPATTMRSELTTFRFETGDPDYTPHNYNNKYANSDITLAQALAVSDNVYAVKTHLFLGQETLAETAKKLGISTKMATVPSLALGTSGVRVIEMANAYGMFANGGKYIEPTLITKVETSDGKIIYKKDNSEENILDPAKAYVMTHMMTGVFDTKLNGYANVTGSTIVKGLTRPYAGKSGSTPTDSWMIGYSPQLVSAVWTGYDDARTIDIVAEKSYAKQIWAKFMEEALQGKTVKSFKPPKEGVTGVHIDPANGKLATKECPVRRFTYFVSGTEPDEYCTDHLENGKTKPGKGPWRSEKKSWYKKLWDWGG